jgi:hypothetical protein
MPLRHYMKPNLPYPSNNLFYRYHLQQYEENTNKNSKLVTATFNVNPALFPLLDFSKLYYFDNAYFRINKIFDYKPYVDTRIEFVKTVSYTKPAAGSGSGNGGNDDFDNFGDLYPSGLILSPARGNNNKNSIGANNNITNDSVAVGSNNNAPTGTISFLSSNNNNVNSGVTQAVLINTNSETITENGVYVDGKKLVLPDIYNLTAINATTLEVLQPISEFTFDVNSGKTYIINIIGYYQCNAPNEAIKLGTIPTDADGEIRGLWSVTDFHGSAEDLHTANIRSLTDLYLGEHVGISDLDFNFRGEFVFECTTTGSITIGYSGTSGNQVTISQKSKLEVIEL